MFIRRRLGSWLVSGNVLQSNRQPHQWRVRSEGLWRPIGSRQAWPTERKKKSKGQDGSGQARTGQDIARTGKT